MFSYAPVEEGGLMVGDGLDLDWHHAALIELCRVSRFEVRIYPAHTTALIAERHHYAKWLLNHLPLGWNGEFTTPHYFEGMIGCTDCLRLWLSSTCRGREEQCISNAPRTTPSAKGLFVSHHA